MKFILIILTLWSSVVLSAPATQNEIEELKKRIEDLEKQQELLIGSSAEPRPQVNSFLRDNLVIGGFFEAGYNFITGPDTDTQGVNDGNVLGLNIAADFGSRFRFVSQIVAGTNIPFENRDNNPSANPEQREYNRYTAIGAVTQGYVEYSHSRKFNVQAGLGYVPFGFALQLREPVLYVRRGGPQIVRNPSLISILWQGVHLYGSQNNGKGEIGYNLYTFTPTSEAKFPGIGGRLWFSNENEKIIGGLNAQFSEKDTETFTNVGGDLRFDFNPFQVRTELLHKFTQNADSWSAYIEPGYYFGDEEFLFYVFGDYLYSSQNEVVINSATVFDPIQKWEYGLGLNWLPTSFTRFRWGFTYHDYVGYRAKIDGQDRDYISTDVSVGVAF